MALQRKPARLAGVGSCLARASAMTCTSHAPPALAASSAAFFSSSASASVVGMATPSLGSKAGTGDAATAAANQAGVCTLASKLRPYSAPRRRVVVVMKAACRGSVRSMLQGEGKRLVPLQKASPCEVRVSAGNWWRSCRMRVR